MECNYRSIIQTIKSPHFIHFLPFTFIIKMHKRLTSRWPVIVIWHEPIWPDSSLFFFISELRGAAACSHYAFLCLDGRSEAVPLTSCRVASAGPRERPELSFVSHSRRPFLAVLTWQQCALWLLGCCQSLGPETGVSRLLPKIRLRNLDAGWQFTQQLQPNWHRWKNRGESKRFQTKYEVCELSKHYVNQPWFLHSPRRRGPSLVVTSVHVLVPWLLLPGTLALKGETDRYCCGDASAPAAAGRHLGRPSTFLRTLVLIPIMAQSCLSRGWG